MKIAVFIAFFLSLVLQNINTQYGEVQINGYAPDYAGKIVDFYFFLEKHFDSRETIASVKIDETGNFNFTCNCRQTLTLFCESPVYTGFIFIEPGRNYSISLPPIPPENLQYKGDPFFISPYWHMLPKDSLFNGFTDLNYSIRNYDIEYEPFANKQLLRYNNPELSKTKLDSFIIATKPESNTTDPVFLRDYIKYRTAQMQILVSEYNRSVLYETYFKNHPLPMNNPAFWDFYKFYFDHYISALTIRREFADIYQLMGKKLYTELTNKLKNDPVLENDTIREFVLLDELYQGFYRNDYPLQLTLNLIDTIGKRSVSTLTKNIATNLLSSITSLQPGYFPPQFSLCDSNGKEYTRESFKGKYCYIGFCSLKNIGCQKEFEYLKYINSRHNKYLQIITIVPENEKSEIPSFVDFNSIGWPVLFSKNNDSLFKNYKIKTFPSFFLLNKESKLALSPSPFPSENFEQVLFGIMRANGDIK